MMWQLLALWLSAHPPDTFSTNLEWVGHFPRTSTFTFQSGHRELCRITPNGFVTCADGVTAEDVARAWACTYTTNSEPWCTLDTNNKKR